MKNLFILFLPVLSFGQIKADGITDDLAALKEWAKRGGGYLPENKIIRITDSWCIGEKELSEAQMFAENAVPLINAKLYQVSKFTRAIKLLGNNTTIWLDNPDTTKAVICYNAKGLKDDNNSGLIEGITVKGRGVGISSSFTKKLRIHNVNFVGLNIGLLLNNAVLFDCQNLTFKNCRLAEYDQRCHRSNFSNISVEFCKKGFEIHSNQIIVNGYNASFCNVGLHVAAGNNSLNSVYLETKYEGEGQLLIGDTAGRKVHGNVFTALTISAPYLTAIKWLPTAGNMSIDGGEIQSTYFSVTGKPTVWVKNLLGTLPKEITKLL